MIRGLEKVIHPNEMNEGRFYFGRVWGGGSILFQCITSGQARYALIFSVDGKPALTIDQLPTNEPLVALPEVFVRVDPPSLTGSAFSSRIDSGMFIVSGNEAFVAASQQRFNWALINISSGSAVEGNFDPSWLSFSRWSLVVDEGGQEITIASFGDAPNEQ